MRRQARTDVDQRPFKAHEISWPVAGRRLVGGQSRCYTKKQSREEGGGAARPPVSLSHRCRRPVVRLGRRSEHSRLFNMAVLSAVRRKMLPFIFINVGRAPPALSFWQLSQSDPPTAPRCTGEPVPLYQFFSLPQRDRRCPARPIVASQRTGRTRSPRVAAQRSAWPPHTVALRSLIPSGDCTAGSSE